MVGAPGDGGETRVGLVVGRNVGGAVTRNRSKRRLRHAIEKIPLEQGMDYVIIGDQRVFDVHFEKLTAWLREAVDDLR